MARPSRAVVTSARKTRAAAVDLFCGVGGLTYGLRRAGVTVVAGIDLDPNCAYPYEKNNGAKFLERDIAKVTGKELIELYPANAQRILAGCAPCQPFSTLNQGRDAQQDTKWGLLDHFGRLVEEIGPGLVTMENVPQLRKHKVFSDFVARLKRLRFHVNYSVLYCPDYGVPQERSRLVLLAAKDAPVPIPTPTHSRTQYRTVRDAIRRLPRLKAGQANRADPLHRAAGLTPRNLKRIQSSVPGGTWRDWDSKLRLDCHKAETGESYCGVYGRMEWDRPAPTITTECYNLGPGRFGHPSQDRAISLREAALLQTFPRHYEFTRPDAEITLKAVGTLIGNAVPVRLGEVIGRALLEHCGSQRRATRRRSGQTRLADPA